MSIVSTIIKKLIEEASPKIIREDQLCDLLPK